MGIEVVKITQKDIDDQNRDYDKDYLVHIKVGDWVYDDGEILCSQACIDHWYHTSGTDEETNRWLRIFERLDSLNNQ